MAYERSKSFGATTLLTRLDKPYDSLAVEFGYRQTISIDVESAETKIILISVTFLIQETKLFLSIKIVFVNQNFQMISCDGCLKSLNSLLPNSMSSQQSNNGQLLNRTGTNNESEISNIYLYIFYGIM